MMLYGINKHMKINEIYKEKGYPSDTYMSEMVKERFDLYKKKIIGNIGNLTVWYGISNIGTNSYFLSDRKNPIAQFSLREDDLGFRVSSVWIDPEYRGKGTMKKLYQFILDKNIKIISDHSQTTSAINLWKSFIDSGQLYYLDTNNNISTISDIENFDKVYNGTNDRLILSKLPLA